jgi:hypothetical protein
MSSFSFKSIAVVIVLALIVATSIIRVDNGGTVWPGFLLYAGTIVGTYLLTLISPAGRCGWPLFRRQPKS